MRWGAAMTDSEPVQAAGASPQPKLKPAKGSYISEVALLLALLFGVAVPIALLIWQGVAATAPVRSGSAGAFVAAIASQGGFFAPTLTTVQTSAGSVVVQGTFSAPRGRDLVVEESNKTGLQLCALGDQETCVPLVGTWAGPLSPTPVAPHVFNFVEHGLGTDNLQRWLEGGLIVAFVAFLGVIAGAVPRLLA